jgi:hypothetical protein
MNQNAWIDLLLRTSQEQLNGIVFGATRFSEPTRFSSSLPPLGGGLYAVLVPNSTVEPKPFRVIYFGQAGNLNDRVTRGHEKFQEWLNEAGSISRLHVSFHTMPGDESERRSVEQQLIEQYQPACNTVHNAGEVPSHRFYRIAAEMVLAIQAKEN